MVASGASSRGQCRHGHKICSAAPSSQAPTPHCGAPKARGLTAKARTERSSMVSRCTSSSDTVREVEYYQARRRLSWWRDRRFRKGLPMLARFAIAVASETTSPSSLSRLSCCGSDKCPTGPNLELPRPSLLAPGRGAAAGLGRRAIPRADTPAPQRAGRASRCLGFWCFGSRSAREPQSGLAANRSYREPTTPRGLRCARNSNLGRREAGSRASITADRIVPRAIAKFW